MTRYHYGFYTGETAEDRNFDITITLLAETNEQALAILVDLIGDAVKRYKFMLYDITND